MPERKLVIMSPRPGEAVEWKVAVRVAVPGDLKHLRLFVKSGDDLWHAQPPGQATPTPEVWEAVCTFGNPDSFDGEFKLLAIQSDATTPPAVREGALPLGSRSDVVVVRRQGGAAPAKAESKSLFRDLLVAAVSVVLTLAGTHYYGQYSGRMRYLPYVVQSTPSLIGRPDLKGKEMKVTIDGRPVENVSSAVVAVLNNTDEDFEDLPITVTFAGSGSTPPSLIQEDLKSQPDDVQHVPSAPGAQNAISFAYNVKVANHNPRMPVFTASYLFSGSSVPEVAVAVRKKGVETERVEIASETRNGSNWFGSGEVIFFAAIGFGYCLLRIVGTLFRSARTWVSRNVSESKP